MSEPRVSHLFDTGQWNEPKDFLDLVRKHMPVLLTCSNPKVFLVYPDDDENSKVSRYILPKAMRPKEVVRLVVVGREGKHITFFITKDDLYLAGFKTHAGVYYLFNTNLNVGQTPDDVVEEIPFKENYTEMFSAWSGASEKRFGLLLGKEALIQVIDDLNGVLNKETMARCLLVVTIMICEGVRFSPIGCWCSFMDAFFPRWMNDLIDMWSKLSERLQAYSELQTTADRSLFDFNPPDQAGNRKKLSDISDNYEAPEGWTCWDSPGVVDENAFYDRSIPPSEINTAAKVLYTMAVLKHRDSSDPTKTEPSPKDESHSSGGPSGGDRSKSKKGPKGGQDDKRGRWSGSTSTTSPSGSTSGQSTKSGSGRRRRSCDGEAVHKAAGNIGDELMISPSLCKGTQQFVHRSCLDHWRSVKARFAFSHCTTCKAPSHLQVALPGDKSWRTVKFRLSVTRDVVFAFLVVQTVIAAMGGSAYLMDKDGSFSNSFSDGWDLLSKPPIPFYYCIGDELMISPCMCKGTEQFVHLSCLDQWRSVKAMALLGDKSWQTMKFRLFVTRDAVFAFLAVQTVIAAMGGSAYLMDKDGSFSNSFSDGWDLCSKHPIPFYYCIGNELMISPCMCKGTQQFVHRSCLDHWRSVKARRICFPSLYNLQSPISSSSGITWRQVLANNEIQTFCNKGCCVCVFGCANFEFEIELSLGIILLHWKVIAAMGGSAYLMDKDGSFSNSFSDGWDLLSKPPIPFYYCIGNLHILQLWMGNFGLLSLFGGGLLCLDCGFFLHLCHSWHSLWFPWCHHGHSEDLAHYHILTKGELTKEY
ncbi:hypothetical protein Tsubulata_038677 [Turnera subulata]|uniref:RING-CH-type domain-containing protein n=1 Tax=Turnera subulata TaxID=218843 RepID=A0A9Q0JKB1_9ROSI|nr:hypothetical protein Tsubulata_038677 [Turnera subulata]